MTKEECIKKLKELDLDPNKYTIENRFSAIRRIAEEYDGLEDILNEYLDEDDAEKYVMSVLSNQGLFHTIQCINSLQECNCVYHLDGYGNLEDVTMDTLEGLRDELIDAVESEEEDD